MPHPDHPADRGFTLIELLIVIVILGVLATIVVFAVRGIKDDGTASAREADERILATAEEAYMAHNGSYAPEADLVTADLLREESDLHDIVLAGGDYTLTYVGPGGSSSSSAFPPPTPIDVNGFAGLLYGDPVLFDVVIMLPFGQPSLNTAWNDYVAACGPPVGFSLVLIDDPAFDVAAATAVIPAYPFVALFTYRNEVGLPGWILDQDPFVSGFIFDWLLGSPDMTVFFGCAP